MGKTSKTIEEMQIERRVLDRQIRAAKRAAAKAERERLLSARQALGVWLAEVAGADTVAAVGALQTALETGQFRRFLQQALTPGSSDNSDNSRIGGGFDGSAQ